MITTERSAREGSGKQRPAKSGDLPSKGAEMRRKKLKPGGVSGAEIMMVNLAFSAFYTCPFVPPHLRGGLHGPDNTTSHHRLHIV